MRSALPPEPSRKPPGGRARLAAILLAAILLALIPLVSQHAIQGSDAAGLRLPPDRVLNDQTASPAPVLFRHTTHVAFQDNRCLGCHPRPFSILGRHDPVSHQVMSQGRSCGRCHNGRDATGIDDPDTCAVCHTGEVAR